MDLKNVLAFNGTDHYDDGVYISPEDIDFVKSNIDQFKNRTTTIFTKAGNKIEVLGNAYYILDLEKCKE